MTAAKAKTETRTIAQFTGHAGVERVLTRANQNEIVGAAVATRDLVWKPGNKKVDVTEAHEDVITYLKEDPRFDVKDVEVPVGAEETVTDTP